MNIKDKSACSNLDAVCEWAPINSANPVTPPTGTTCATPTYVIPDAMTTSCSSPYWDTTSCSWNCKQNVMPTGGKCFPLDRADTAALKEACYAATDAGACPTDMCIWKDVAPVNPVPTGGKCVQLATTNLVVDI